MADNCSEFDKSPDECIVTGQQTCEPACFSSTSSPERRHSTTDRPLNRVVTITPENVSIADDLIGGTDCRCTCTLRKLAGVRNIECGNTDVNREVLYVHHSMYVQHMDSLKWENRATMQVARECVGCVLLAVEMVLTGDYRYVFCNVPIPGRLTYKTAGSRGHVFNNVMVGVAQINQIAPELNVAIVCWSSSPSHGIISMAGDQINCLCISICSEDICRVERKSNVVNIVVPVDSTADEYLKNWNDHALPALRDYAPDIVLISCSFDAHVGDRSTLYNLHETDYGRMTTSLCLLPTQPAIISVLENGESYSSLTDCTYEHVRAMMHAPILSEEELGHIEDFTRQQEWLDYCGSSTEGNDSCKLELAAQTVT